jgi:hypothetical protein
MMKKMIDSIQTQFLPFMTRKGLRTCPSAVMETATITLESPFFVLRTVTCGYPLFIDCCARLHGKEHGSLGHVQYPLLIPAIKRKEWTDMVHELGSQFPHSFAGRLCNSSWRTNGESIRFQKTRHSHIFDMCSLLSKGRQHFCCFCREHSDRNRNSILSQVAQPYKEVILYGSKHRYTSRVKTCLVTLHWELLDHGIQLLLPPSKLRGT